MAKKANRNAARGKARPAARRTQRPGPAPATSSDGQDEALLTEPAPASVSSTATLTAPRAAIPTRRAGQARRAATTTFNYAYLKRDITYLAILAPAMIVLVVVAYFVLH